MKRFLDYLAYFAVALAVAAIAALFIRNSHGGVHTIARDGIAMDTLIRVTVHAPMPKGELEGILDEAFALIDHLDKLFSMYDPGSDIAMLNADAGSGLVAASPEVYSVLKSAVAYAALTGGAFDPTVGPLSALWKDSKLKGRAPAGRDVLRAVSLVDYEALRFPGGNCVYLATPGGMVDLGGIGKGYASRRVADLLRARGVESALIDLGGNVVAVGTREGGKLWRIGIQNPYRSRSTALCAVEVMDTAVVTAGVYERFAEIDDRRYTHIYNPMTGYPLEGDLLSATVIAHDAEMADALATAFMVMGVPASLEILAQLPGVEAVFVSKTAEDAQAGEKLAIVATEGLQGSLRLIDEAHTLAFARPARHTGP